MKAEQDSVVEFHYELKGDTGETLESTREGRPLAILLGRHQVVFGLERSLEGREAGERFEVAVPAAEGYGPRREDWTQRIPKSRFQRPGRLRPGERVVIRTDREQRTVTVRKVGRSVVDVDMNHPLAGRDLSFAVEVLGVRPADPAEIAHGHVHGPPVDGEPGGESGGESGTAGGAEHDDEHDHGDADGHE